MLRGTVILAAAATLLGTATAALASCFPVAQAPAQSLPPTITDDTPSLMRSPVRSTHRVPPT